jgi:hypothetical protein
MRTGKSYHDLVIPNVLFLPHFPKNGRIDPFATRFSDDLLALGCRYADSHKGQRSDLFRANWPKTSP